MAGILSQMFQQKHQQAQPSSPLDQLRQIQQAGPSNAIFNQMYQNNPNFKQFADKVRNMSPEQAFQQYGLDFNKFKGFKW